MTQKEFREYKDEYLQDFKTELEVFLNRWIHFNNSKYDKKLNDVIVETFTNDYKRIKTLSFFPEFDLPE